MKNTSAYFLLILLLSGSSFLTGCNDDAVPAAENEEELITDVRLIFTPASGGTPVIVTATDPDGQGPQDLQAGEEIALAANTTYTLELELENSIAGEDITEEIEEEAGEHLFFFGWTNDLFSSPTGEGNIDNRNDPVIYNDTDQDQLPLGLSTTWTTADTGSGTFRIVLKHQPGLKSETSTVQDGETDVDINWSISIQ